MNKSYNNSLKSSAFSISNYDYKTLSRLPDNNESLDCVRVEISDLDNSCPHATTLSLMRCKKQILGPFRNLLCLIGWRKFGADSLLRSSLLMTIFNVIYPVFILLLLLFNYTYEIIVCQGKLNVATDTKTTTTTVLTTTVTLTENYTIFNWSSLLPPKPIHRVNTTDMGPPMCGHILSTYILPNLLHFIAFIIGFIYFRKTEGEPMYSLMEKVFIHADQNMRRISPERVIRRLKFFLSIGVIWVLTSVATRALSNAMNDFAHPLIFDKVNYQKRKSVRYTLFVLDIACLLISDCVHLAIVMYFACHCEMVVFYCKSIRARLEEKSIHLTEAMKQILDLSTCVNQLNSVVSGMVSILVVYYLERTILGIILLLVNEIAESIMSAYRVLYPVVWFSILLFCFGEAARVTSKCDKFHRIGLSMRVYGYHKTNPSDLDGFLLFLSKANLHARLFGLTIRPGNIIFVLVTMIIVFIVLLQTNIINSSAFFFQ